MTAPKRIRPAEIYALIDPRDGAIRYIGKANDSRKRLVKHMAEARRRRTPVYDWINMLGGMGMRPTFIVLEQADDWIEAERRHIAGARKRGERLLNIADGGDEPFCSTEVRAANGKASAAKRLPNLYRVVTRLGMSLHFARKHSAPEFVARLQGKHDKIKATIERMRKAGRVLELEAAYAVIVAEWDAK